MRIALVLAIVLATTLPCTAGTPPRVRGASPRETRLIRDLLARSATARALVAEIDSTDLIVYVQLTVEQPAGRGATRLAAATEHHRYVRIVLGTMTHPADRGALLAHELQHAVEIGNAPEVRDEHGLRQLYSRIGENSRGRYAFETSAAREVGARVLREIATRSRAVAGSSAGSGR